MIDFPQIDPVAFSLGPFSVRWYALSYLAGFLLAWRYCMRLADLDDVRPDRKDIDDFLTWAIVGVILGGRLGYVLFYQFDYYLGNPGDILKLWQGGMAFHGGALGVIVALILCSHTKQISFLRLGDIVCAGVPIGLFFGRLANFINGELYGRVTDSPLGIVFPRGGPLPRHPSQLYEAVLEGAVLFVMLLIMMRIRAVRDMPGIVAGTFLAGYGVFRGFVEFFREPDAHIGFIGQVTMGQILSAPMIAVGLMIILYAVQKHKSDAQNS
ncbi:MAG: prolipoprotein diacylglyceryl transferase [Pseudomonadota bacterium]